MNDFGRSKPSALRLRRSAQVLSKFQRRALQTRAPVFQKFLTIFPQKCCSPKGPDIFEIKVFENKLQNSDLDLNISLFQFKVKDIEMKVRGQITPTSLPNLT